MPARTGDVRVHRRGTLVVLADEHVMHGANARTCRARDHGPSSYGDAFADVYDAWYPTLGDEQACVDALAELAGAGRVLELGVGTGRLALPLAARGLDVTGVDASEAMVARLRAKPGSSRVRVVLGDMADVALTGPFSLVFVAYNTLFNLADEAAQRRCLAGVARVLEGDGTLVIEAFVPPDGPTPVTPVTPVAKVHSFAPDRVVLTVSRHDPVQQVITGHHIEADRGGVRVRPWRVRYLHTRQLDELAERAGLALVARQADWSGATFDDTSPTHVSRYRPMSSC